MNDLKFNLDSIDNPTREDTIEMLNNYADEVMKNIEFYLSELANVMTAMEEFK